MRTKQKRVLLSVRESEAMMTTPESAEMFWRKVNKTNPDGCWEWDGVVDGSGYGMVMRWKATWKAHRLAWSLTHGTIPEGLCVCHKCDNPPCCNPAHLFLGTHIENMQDMVRKGRVPDRRGELHPRAKVTEQDVMKIRELRKTGTKIRVLCADFGLSMGSITSILSRKNWKHVP